VAEPVNADPPRREQARTRLARRAVVDAARELFLDGGYAGTSVAAISARAGVPEPTVYRLFSSKVGILKVLLDVSIAGDDEPVALPQRAEVAAVLEGPDPQALLDGFAGITTHINQRTNAVYTVLDRAADSDPEAAALLDSLREQRSRGQQQVVRALQRMGSLRPGLTRRDAADIVHAVMSPEVYRLLVRDRGWTPDRYRTWAARLLLEQLT
jgi:AcrR family transcriptional regulator